MQGCRSGTTARCGFPWEKDPVIEPDCQSYFPLSRSLAMVANCMFDVPS